MNQHRDLDPFTAEQLLGGAPVDGEVGPLADLLAAAAAPARADELTGEAAAVAAFRDAAGAPRPATVPASRPAGRALGLKVAIAVAAVAGAGVAGAAVAGVFPGGSAADVPAAVPSSSTSTTSTPPPVHASEGDSARPTEPVTGKTGGPSTKPRATRTPRSTPSHHPSTPHRPPSTAVPRSFYQQCATYLAYDAWDHYGDRGQYYYGRQSPRQDDGRTEGNRADRLLDDPSYRPLVKAAGGKSNVKSYCMRLLQNSRGARGPEAAPPPSPPVRPSGRPTSDPTSRPAASQTGEATTALPPPRGR